MWGLWKGEDLIDLEEIKIKKYILENGIKNNLDAGVQQIFLIFEKLEKEIENEKEIF